MSAAAPVRRVRTTMGARIAIGQRWRRRRDNAWFVVRQVHRADRMAEMVNADGEKLWVAFSELGRKWELIA